MKRARRRVDVNLQELDEVLDQAQQAPLSEPDYQKLKGTLHTLVESLAQPRSSEKTSAVLAEAIGAALMPESSPDTQQHPRVGHGRNSVAAFTGARTIAIQHAKLQSGNRCPECGTEGAEGAGADCGTGAAGGYRV
jgi:hypothetical protein